MGLFTTPLDSLARELGLPAGVPFAVQRQGRTFTAKYLPAQKSVPARMRFTAQVDTSVAPTGNPFRELARAHVARRPALVLRKESALDRFGKRYGLNREVQTGDAAFDDAIYIESDAPEDDIQQTVASPGLRAAVRALIDVGASAIELDDAGLSTTREWRYDFGSTRERFEETAAMLGRIAAELPLFDPGPATKRRPWVVEIVALITLPMVLAIALGLGPPSPLGSGATWASLAGGLALWALAMTAVVRLFRGRSDALRRVVCWGFLLLFTAPVSTYIALVGVNDSLDASPAVAHPTTIVHAWYVRNKNQVSHYINVDSWRPGEALLRLEVSSAFAKQATEGKRIVVTTHAGRLGWEWVEEFHLVSP